jgi:carboxylesterase type B
LQSPGVPTAEALAALRSLPAEKLLEGASAPEVPAGLSREQPVVGVSGSILDGRFLTKSPEATFAAGKQTMVPVIRDKWKGTLHGFEIPYAFNVPAAHLGDEVTDADKAMGVLASGYWVAFW